MIHNPMSSSPPTATVRPIAVHSNHDSTPKKWSAHGEAQQRIDTSEQNVVD
jgi:hypothetical protein